MNCPDGQAWMPDTWVRKRGLAKNLIPVWINGVEVTALIALRCSQMLI